MQVDRVMRNVRAITSPLERHNHLLGMAVQADPRSAPAERA
jgi:hypothetical protein